MHEFLNDGKPGLRMLVNNAGFKVPDVDRLLVGTLKKLRILNGNCSLLPFNQLVRLWKALENVVLVAAQIATKAIATTPGKSPEISDNVKATTSKIPKPPKP